MAVWGDMGIDPVKRKCINLRLYSANHAKLAQITEYNRKS